MGAVATKAAADLRRRRLQALVLATVLFLSSGAATLALSILIETHGPFERAFERANGAHLVVDFDASTSASQLRATTTASAVTTSAGPWPVSSVAFRPWTGGLIPERIVSGRPQPDGTIDQVTMIAGRWWSAPGEVVLEQDAALLLGLGIGDSLPVYADRAGGRKLQPGGGNRAVVPPPGAEPDDTPLATLTIVGIAASVSTPDTAAWMHPDDVAAVTPTATPDVEMHRSIWKFTHIPAPRPPRPRRSSRFARARWDEAKHLASLPTPS